MVQSYLSSVPSACKLPTIDKGGVASSEHHLIDSDCYLIMLRKMHVREQHSRLFSPQREHSFSSAFIFLLPIFSRFLLRVAANSCSVNTGILILSVSLPTCWYAVPSYITLPTFGSTHDEFKSVCVARNPYSVCDWTIGPANCWLLLKKLLNVVTAGTFCVLP